MPHVAPHGAAIVDENVIEQLPLVRTPSGVRLASEMTSEPAGRGGIPVVFLHATGFSRGVWRPVARRLADISPGLALDLRGHGDSDKPSPPYYWPLLAEDVAAYVDQLPAGQVVLCGHSVGGSTAVDVAARVPDRVAGLVLVEAGVAPPDYGNFREELVRITLCRTRSWPDRAAAERHLASRSPYRYWDREVLAGYFATGLTRTGKAAGLTRTGKDGCALSCRPKVEASIYAETDTSQAPSLLPQINCPVWILRASGDQGMPTMSSPLEAQLAPNSVDRLVEGSGHFIPMEQPALVARYIRELLTKLQR